MIEHSRILELFEIELPIVQAPMAGAQDHELAIAVANAGGLGSIACAILSVEAARKQALAFRAASTKPLNMNFFCHALVKDDAQREALWRAEFVSLYAEFHIDVDFNSPPSPIQSFSCAMCELVEQIKPETVSFHFGLPEQNLLDRVRGAGAKIIATATTVGEAIYLSERGCDAIIAQGIEAGGHRSMFLSGDLKAQSTTMSLVSRLVDVIDMPVIASGGIADGKAVAVALTHGAGAVQIGTRYLKTPEAKIASTHRQILNAPTQPDTVITNIFTGHPARSFTNRVIREIGPMNKAVQAFPFAMAALSPLKKATTGLPDFIPLWAGQSAHIGSFMGAGELTRKLAADAQGLLENTLIHRSNFQPT